MISFIEEHRNSLGVEPVCKVLPIAQSTFYAHAAIVKNPDLASDRAKRDAVLSPEIKRVWEENNEVYGIRKVWHQLQREKFSIARCTVARLMKRLDIHGVIRGKAKRTTVQDKSLPCPKDKVNRKFRAPAPNMLWVSDFTYVSTWQGFVYVAFIIDTFADKIVGWRVSSSPKRISCWMRWNRRCMIAAPFTKAASSTIRTVAGNICPFAILRDWPWQGLSPQSAALVIPMTMLWPKP